MSEPFSLVSSTYALACSNATGYEFRVGVPPTRAQLRKMCGQDDCIQQINRSLLRPRNGPARTKDEMRLLNEFAHVVVDYCYYYHEPGEPCPRDFVGQFFRDLQDLVDACEIKSTFSFTSNETSVSRMCSVNECDNVIRRLYVKPYIRTCEPMMNLTGGIPSDYEVIMTNWVYPYKKKCPVANTPTWFLPPTYFGSYESIKYVYLPGPLPGDMAILTPSPSPRPSPTQTLESTQTPLTLPKSDSKSSSASSDTSSDSSSSGESILVESTLPSRTPKTTPTTKHDDTVLVPTASALDASDSSMVWIIVAGVTVVLGVLVVFIFHSQRRRRAKSMESVAMLSSVSDNHQLRTLDPPPIVFNEFHSSQLEDIRIISGGGNGIVYLVRDIANNRLLASKRLNGRNPNTDTDAFMAEITLAASLSHPQIVQFVGIAGLHKSELQGLFEYMAGGDLCRYLSVQPPPSPTHHSWTTEKLQIAIDVADALGYIHTITPLPIVHRDLKSRNVLLTSDKRAKLGDFGVSRETSERSSMTTGVGTSRWVAPEVIAGGGTYSTACDVYSFGVVLTELDTHQLPFSDLVNSNGDQLIDFALLEMVASGQCKPSLSATCPPPIRDLVLRCLAFQPADRPTASRLASTLRHIQQDTQA